MCIYEETRKVEHMSMMEMGNARIFVGTPTRKGAINQAYHIHSMYGV